jgi:hypothetical protein
MAWVLVNHAVLGSINAAKGRKFVSVLNKIIPGSIAPNSASTFFLTGNGRTGLSIIGLHCQPLLSMAGRSAVRPSVTRGVAWRACCPNGALHGLKKAGASRFRCAFGFSVQSSRGNSKHPIRRPKFGKML